MGVVPGGQGLRLNHDGNIGMLDPDSRNTYFRGTQQHPLRHPEDPRTSVRESDEETHE